MLSCTASGLRIRWVVQKLKFNINGFVKLFILSFTMVLGFFTLYALILGVPTTLGATVFLVLLAGASVLLYFLVCKERGAENG